MLFVKFVIIYLFGFTLGWIVNKIVMTRKIKMAYTDGMMDGLELKKEGDMLIKSFEEGEE